MKYSKGLLFYVVLTVFFTITFFWDYLIESKLNEIALFWAFIGINYVIETLVDEDKLNLNFRIARKNINLIHFRKNINYLKYLSIAYVLIASISDIINFYIVIIAVCLTILDNILLIYMVRTRRLIKK